MNKYDSIGEMLRDHSVIWYGPHECNGCGAIIVKSSIETGAVALDAPHDHHYPNHQWRLHLCKADGIHEEMPLNDAELEKIKAACGASEPSSGHTWADEIIGLLRVARSQRDEAEKRCAYLRSKMGGVANNTTNDSVKPPLDCGVGKVIRIKSPAPHPHSLWRITAHMHGASQQENLVAIRRLEINPGNNVEGKVQEDSVVPMALLSTHPAIENV